jgi:hypothetical protein
MSDDLKYVKRNGKINIGQLIFLGGTAYIGIKMNDAGDMLHLYFKKKHKTTHNFGTIDIIGVIKIK